MILQGGILHQTKGRFNSKKTIHPWHLSQSQNSKKNRMTVLENESQNTMYISSIHLKADLIGNLPLASSFFLKKKSHRNTQF
jgi:hypothetical protein